ncbi:uncharacterized protein LOC114522819 [Dendronephthya gigantea]|uniref:uncharacterized protein LOC114522819 n=1 Tax=Dendronephthya gigantea TaxID=151771 RepID=UPI00106AC5D1|nr:uncharacterized protein LOC114522819 [Dendronephthya gigantea]
MAGFNLFHTIFGLIFVLWPCQGQIISPPGGDELTFLLGSNATIAWSTRDPDNVVTRSWTFIGNKTRLIASSGVKGAGLQYFGSGLDVKIQGLETLVLINVNESYDGIYRFGILHPVTGSYVSDVRVIIPVRPVVSLDCSTLITLNEGENFVCLCRSEDGKPPANVTWYKNEVKFTDVGTEKQILNLINVSSTDGGTYKCVATNYPDENYTGEKFIQVIIYCKYMFT